MDKTATTLEQIVSAAKQLQEAMNQHNGPECFAISLNRFDVTTVMDNRARHTYTIKVTATAVTELLP